MKLLHFIITVALYNKIIDFVLSLTSAAFRNKIAVAFCNNDFNACYAEHSLTLLH